MTDLYRGRMLRPQMGLWRSSQQWVYSRPRVAAPGAILLLLLVGAGGWESARLATPNATQAAAETGRHGVAGAHLIQVEADVGPVTRVVTRVVHRTRRITAHRPTKTVVERRSVTRTVRDTHTIRETVRVAAPAAGRTRTAPRPVGGTPSTRDVTVTEVQTQTVTQPPVTVTVTVTTTRGRGH